MKGKINIVEFVVDIMVNYSIEGAEIIAALTVGAMFGVFGNMLVTLYFRQQDKMPITKSDKMLAIIVITLFAVYTLVSGVFLITQML
jgi:hypothetical protein